MRCCEYQLVLSGEGCCHGDCYRSLSWKHKDHIQALLFLCVLVTDSMERLLNLHRDADDVLKIKRQR